MEITLVVSEHTHNPAFKNKNYENNVIPNVADSNIIKTKVSIYYSADWLNKIIEKPILYCLGLAPFVTVLTIV